METYKAKKIKKKYLAMSIVCKCEEKDPKAVAENGLHPDRANHVSATQFNRIFMNTYATGTIHVPMVHPTLVYVINMLRELRGLGKHDKVERLFYPFVKLLDVHPHVQSIGLVEPPLSKFAEPYAAMGHVFECIGGNIVGMNKAYRKVVADITAPYSEAYKPRVEMSPEPYVHAATGLWFTPDFINAELKSNTELSAAMRGALTQLALLTCRDDETMKEYMKDFDCIHRKIQPPMPIGEWPFLIHVTPSAFRVIMYQVRPSVFQALGRYIARYMEIAYRAAEHIANGRRHRVQFCLKQLVEAGRTVQHMGTVALKEGFNKGKIISNPAMCSSVMGKRSIGVCMYRDEENADWLGEMKKCIHELRVRFGDFVNVFVTQHLPKQKDAYIMTSYRSNNRKFVDCRYISTAYTTVAVHCYDHYSDSYVFYQQRDLLTNVNVPVYWWCRTSEDLAGLECLLTSVKDMIYGEPTKRTRIEKRVEDLIIESPEVPRKRITYLGAKSPTAVRQEENIGSVDDHECDTLPNSKRARVVSSVESTTSAEKDDTTVGSPRISDEPVDTVA